MNDILVAYDISNDAVREGIAGYLESFPTWHHMQDSVYIIATVKTVKEVYDEIKPNVTRGDYLVVVDITKSEGQYNRYVKKSGDN